jgi:hypothetical protein
MCDTGKNNIIIRHDLFILPGSEGTKAKTAAECPAPWRRLETQMCPIKKLYALRVYLMLYFVYVLYILPYIF